MRYKRFRRLEQRRFLGGHPCRNYTGCCCVADPRSTSPLLHLAPVPSPPRYNIIGKLRWIGNWLGRQTRDQQVSSLSGLVLGSITVCGRVNYLCMKPVT